MSDTNKITWVIKHSSDKYGDILLRIGRDSEENVAISTSCVLDGVQYGTSDTGNDIRVLTDLTDEQLQKMLDEHFERLAPFFQYKGKERAFEKDWFKLFELENLGLFLVEFNPLDKEVVLTTFDTQEESFWSAKIHQEHFYDLDLEEYEEDFDKIMVDMNEEIVMKLFAKGLTEEDWIC